MCYNILIHPYTMGGSFHTMSPLPDWLNMPEFGTTYKQEPVKQKVTVHAILAPYPPILMRFIAVNVLELVAHTKGFRPIDGEGYPLSMAVTKHGFMMQKLTLTFPLINGASMAEEEEFKSVLYSFFMECNSRKFGVTMERIEQ